MNTPAHTPISTIRSKIALLLTSLFTLPLLTLLPSLASAAISLNVTRVIFDQQTKEANVRITNEAEQPILIQTWIDNGDPQTPLEQLTVPFIITPAFFRLETQAIQQLRILLLQTPDTLPADKESIFWLNVQEVPPVPQASNDYMQIALRTRIKIFYRPTSIPFNTERLHQQLTFNIAQQNGLSVLQIHNPTPIHITFLKITIGPNQSNPAHTFEPEDSMVSPYSTLSIPFESNTPFPSENTPVHYIFLDDFGVATEYKTQLTK